MVRMSDHSHALTRVYSENPAASSARQEATT
jgi:hypothetical protein